MPHVYVAAGSDIDPERHLALAVTELERGFGPIEVSPWYRNVAAGFEGPDFINFAVGFETAEPLSRVVERLREIEVRCGRPREAPKWAPRAMDLDILLYGDCVCGPPGPVLPRPDLLKRAYMLGPLADIAPDLVHPTAGATIGELWRGFDRAAHPLVRLPCAVSPGRSGRRPPPGSDP